MNTNLKNKEFSFKTTETADVIKMLQAIEPSKAAGLDGINGIFLKDVAIILVEPIRDIFNLSIKLSTFPDKCKVAKVKPLYTQEL